MSDPRTDSRPLELPPIQDTVYCDTEDDSAELEVVSPEEVAIALEFQHSTEEN